MESRRRDVNTMLIAPEVTARLTVARLLFNVLRLAQNGIPVRVLLQANPCTSGSSGPPLHPGRGLHHSRPRAPLRDRRVVLYRSRSLQSPEVQAWDRRSQKTLLQVTERPATPGACVWRVVRVCIGRSFDVPKSAIHCGYDKRRQPDLRFRRQHAPERQLRLRLPPGGSTAVQLLNDHAVTRRFAQLNHNIPA